MCGIAGVVDWSSSQPEESLLRRMLGLLRHRGPDAFGIYLDDHAGLAHARLSIIDLSGGDQPIHNEDRTVWIAYNGEVFNYPELREKLVEHGHRFYTQTDTEILVHLYEEKGPELFADLNGQFAVAIWDQRKKQLLLGRDRMGIRPLYYYRGRQRLVFGSEIKALFADPRVPRAIDPRALADCFTCWSPLGSLTPFEEIHQLLPGHYAVYSQDGWTTHPYWELPVPAQEEESRPLDDWVMELKDLLHDATRIRLRADVPVGAYLSGGLDSTYLSSLVKHSFNNELCTFSVRFDDSRFDETSFQERAMRSLKTHHESIRCADDDIGHDFPQVIWHTETPLLRTAPAPLFRLSGLVHDSDFKVVLSGEGADEIFAGYNIFKEDRVRRFWARQPDSRIRPRLLERLYPYIFAQGDGRARAYLERFFGKHLSDVDLPCYSHMLRWENTSQIKSFFSDELKASLDPDEAFVERYCASLPPDFLDRDPLSQAQYTEITTFLSSYLLSSQGDRMAMAHAVEGRYPFLDHRVVEFAFRLPPRYRLHVLEEKFILKQVARDLVPREIVERPKQPYRAPISHCFFGESPPAYVEELLSESAIRRAGCFHPGRVAKLVEKCRRQEGHLAGERENMALVGILSTQLIDHLFIRGFPPHAVEEPADVTVFRNP